jgi:hypothetical protein
MIDLREEILQQLVAVCAAVPGIVAAVRNKREIPRLDRPAVMILGGAEQLLSRPVKHRFSEISIFELSPQVTLLVRADDGPEAGVLMSLFRARLLVAILDDPVLRNLVTTNGDIRFEGCAELEPLPESKEPRLEMNFVFTYPLRLSDLRT